MKKLSLLLLTLLTCSFALADSLLSPEAQAQSILLRMNLPEKIGQKLMLDFRYWCADSQPCTKDLEVVNDEVKSIISKNHIGGIILFSNNIKDIAQVVTLTNALQTAMQYPKNFQMLIGTDQEGGIVARLPRDVSATFSGNIALTAAHLGAPKQLYPAKSAELTAKDLKAVGININFAPDVDVNVNPLNPVINVRSFSDDPVLVTQLGLQVSQAIQAAGVASTLKHFPGHGDTSVDSHLGLPVVNHTLEEAWKIDLYPFQQIIQQASPDLIMTAHIQFPSLDDSLIYADKIKKYIIAPATLSRRIQYDLIRNKLGYQGVTITDALDMGAISQNFSPIDATIKAFQAGDDIALMPVKVTWPDDAAKVTELVTAVVDAVHAGTISEAEINKSVLRILILKLKLGLILPDYTPLSEKISRAEKLFADPNQRELENSVSDAAITLVQNNHLLPVKAVTKMRIHILTPWLEQGAGIAEEIKLLQADNQLPKDLQISFINMAATDLETEKSAIDNADLVIVGDSTKESLPLNALTGYLKKLMPQDSLAFPEIPKGDTEIKFEKFALGNTTLSDAQFAYQALLYAKNKVKPTIFISLLAPYDLPNYKDVADAMLAAYDFYGYYSDGTHSYFRGPSMQAVTRIIFGIKHSSGKLPVDIPDPATPQKIVYTREFGLSDEF